MKITTLSKDTFESTAGSVVNSMVVDPFHLDNIARKIDLDLPHQH